MPCWINVGVLTLATIVSDEVRAPALVVQDVGAATPRALRSELIIASTSRAAASASAAADAVVSGHSPG